MQFDFRFFFTVTLIVVCGAIAGRSFLQLWRFMMLGRKEALFDRIGTRIGLVLENVIGHKKMMKDFWPGFFHALIFFGFIMVTIGTAEHVIEGVFHGFTLSFLGPVYGVVTTIQDVLQFTVVLAVVYFFYRRLFKKNTRMAKEWRHRRDGLIVLTLTGGHMLADIMAFTFWIAGNDPQGHAAYRPISSMLANLAASTGLNPETAAHIGWIWWGIHVATVFAFLMYIPYSKHLHIITAGPNTFFKRLKPRGTFSTINFEDTANPTFGAAKISDFTWKDNLDLYSCTQCGRCDVFCPTATTGKALRPMKLIDDLKMHLKDVGPAMLANGGTVSPKPMISEETGISLQAIWDCTTCRACVEQCPVMIEHVDKIIDMRRNLVMMEGNMPTELQNTMKNWETQSNPWGMAPDARADWAAGLNVPLFAEKPTAEYLFYVGCAGSFNDRNKKISTSFVKILQKAGIDFAILGKEELCNGETARRAGNEYLAKTMIDANIEVLKRHNVKKILTTCPHCFNTIKNEYPDFGFHAEEVLHHTDFINRLIQQKKITPLNPDAKEGEPFRIAFHDSCYLGRYNDVYEAPREALASIPGVEVVEMPRNKKNGLCCGAGGARMWMEETTGKRINVERTEEALTTKPQVIAAGCPYCQVMITDGVNEKAATNVKVMDVAEIIAEKI